MEITVNDVGNVAATLLKFSLSVESSQINTNINVREYKHLIGNIASK